MNKNDLRKSADTIYSICSKNGSNKLTGYFSSSPSNMWISSEGYLELRSATRNNDSVYETIGTILDNSVIMKQVETKQDNIFYDLISWTSDGSQCTVVNFETKDDLEKVYKDVVEKYKTYINVNNIEQICYETGTRYCGIDYKKFDNSKNKKKENKITAASLLDELEARHIDEEVKGAKKVS